MRLLRGVVALGNQANGIKTVALIYDESNAWIRLGGNGDYPLSQDEVRELAKVFRRCVESWDRAKVKEMAR